MKKNKRVKILKYLNKPILILTILYAILGALLILDASSISSVLTYGNSSAYYFFKKQLIFIGLSLAASLFIIRVNTRWYKGISLILSGIFILLLLYALIKKSLFSSGVNEVTLSILGGSVQPTEFLKVFVVMYMGCFYGSWVNNPNHGKYSWIWPLLICASAILLIALGGDLGSACVMIALFALVFICIPSKEKTIYTTKVLAVCGLVVAVLGLKFAYLIIPEDVLSSSYRLNRFIYTDPCDRYEENSGYQVCNGYIAINNGGLLGSGIGKSVQKYMYLPASHTDFIFPIIVEELGVIIAGLIIVGYMAILYFVFKVATQTTRLQNSIICYGIGIYFMLHIFINLGGVLGIIPLTGVPLPFLSYGGSFCVTLICAFAVVQRINIENQLEKVNK